MMEMDSLLSERRVVIAPIGWYEGRLYKSIFESSPDKVYLIKDSKRGKIAAITKLVAQRIKERLLTTPHGREIVDIQEEVADLRDYEKTFHLFVKIIETERTLTRDSRILIDLSSATKEATIAAALVSRFYKVSLSYVPPEEKSPELKSEVPWSRTMKRLERAMADTGGERLLLPVPAAPLQDQWIRALVEVYALQSATRSEVINALADKDKARAFGTAYRYWSRVLDKLESEGLVETTGNKKKAQMSLSLLARPLVAGLVEVRRKGGH